LEYLLGFDVVEGDAVAVVVVVEIVDYKKTNFQNLMID